VYSETALPVWHDATVSPVWTHYSPAAMEQSFLQQLYGLHRCMEAVRARERATRSRYDYVVRMRPDVAFYAPMATGIDALDYGTPDAPRVLITARGACCCGNDDWFNVGERSVMGRFMDRFLHLQATSHAALFASHWTAELYAVDALREIGADVLEDARLPACLLKPRDRVNPGEP
jgi:hypothetical protein